MAPLPSSFTDEDLAFLRSEGLTLEETKAGSRRLEMAERQILAIATDVDGTLLDNQQELSERTERALLLAQEQGVQVRGVHLQEKTKLSAKQVLRVTPYATFHTRCHILHSLAQCRFESLPIVEACPLYQGSKMLLR